MIPLPFCWTPMRAVAITLVPMLIMAAISWVYLRDVSLWSCVRLRVLCLWHLGAILGFGWGISPGSLWAVAIDLILVNEMRSGCCNWWKGKMKRTAITASDANENSCRVVQTTAGSCETAHI
jgi:hypothetical protein